MRLRHQAAQVPAQPHAASVALAGGIQSEKRLALLKQLVCHYAWAVVAHSQLKYTGCTQQVDFNCPLTVALGVVRDSRQMFRLISVSVN